VLDDRIDTLGNSSGTLKSDVTESEWLYDMETCLTSQDGVVWLRILPNKAPTVLNDGLNRTTYSWMGHQAGLSDNSQGEIVFDG